MSDNTFRKKQYKCETHPIIMEEINCIHWEVENTSCKKTCKLNLFDGPTLHNCMSCSKRESYSKEILEEDVKNLKLTELTVSSRPQINVENIKKYLNAETSQMFSGTVSDETYEKRKNICMSCEFKVNNFNGANDEIGWCTGCGCGVGAERSKLSVKLKMPSLLCPKSKFGPEPGKGFNLIDAKNSISGIASSIKNIIDK